MARRVADRARRSPRRARSGTRAREASRLSFGVAGPVLAGATALKAWRGRGATRDRDARRDRRGGGVRRARAPRCGSSGSSGGAPLWPYAAERALLAGAILAVRYRRAR